ncbi:MAG: hypothetical protein R3358_01630 [Woeseiaceae bacterium]|nr:hypothetical protein [Woeseiaceae bacterium]
MPEFTVIHIGIFTGLTVVGVIAGWIMRGNRCAQEKEAVNAGWQEQIEAQRNEHQRLADQNKSLMQQVSQYQASGKDATNRAKELSDALKEAFERRDELQREIKEIRSSLERVVGERDRLQSDVPAADVLKEKDDKIFKLSRELENWQERLPPLIERYRVRNEEAEQLEAELAEARLRIDALEQMVGSDQTRVEPVDAQALPDDMSASNDSVELPAVDVDDGDDGDDEALVDEAQLLEDEDLDDEDLDDDVVHDGVDDDGDPDEDSNIVDLIAADDDTHVEYHNDVEFAQEKDDLKQIKGVGPAIEKTLNELGIFRLAQIAEMGEYDIDRVARRLKGFRSRIYREDWIGQARELLDASKQA